MVAIRRWHAGTICLLSACSGGDLTLPNANSIPATLRIVAGDNQRAPVGTSLSDPLVVRVTDTDQHPLRGAAVKFRFIGTLPDATLEPEAVTTDEEGRAATHARLGSVPGTQHIVAWLPGGSADAQATFQAVAVTRSGDDDGKGGKGKNKDGD